MEIQKSYEPIRRKDLLELNTLTKYSTEYDLGYSIGGYKGVQF